ncbi:MAG TPA: twin-arginine translocase subunit TatC [Bryobacteraceae bacterium]|nr:twin-arginine translocase subunit TatC [Bryobacteraceae bacterium]
MSSDADKPGAPTPAPHDPPAPASHEAPAAASYTPTVDDSYGYHDDPYAYENQAVPVAQVQPAAPPPPPPPPTPPIEEEDMEEESMLRMSFLEHLEELRTRIIRSLIGMAVVFAFSLTFSKELWKIVSAPAISALKELGVVPPKLVAIAPMEMFSIIWVKLPLLTTVFLGSPWILYQVWAFIAPGLYKRERRWAVPFVVVSAGLFITGGVFAYFVAFRYGLVFLLGIGRDVDVAPMVSITEYFDLFVNVTMGVGLVFEMPILIFFLTLLRLATPRFLLANSRYAILIIVLVAAVVTPTPDIFNLLLFAVPMVLLFFVGIFASHLLVLSRENKTFPWGKLFLWVAIVLALLGGVIALAVMKYGYKFVQTWPFLVK